MIRTDSTQERGAGADPVHARSTALRARPRGGSDRIGSDLNDTPPSPLASEGELAQPCSRCKVKPGDPCVDRSGRIKPRPHSARGRRQPSNRIADGNAQVWERGMEIAAELPNEVPAFVSVAAERLRYGGHPVTAETVLAALRAQGRDRESLDG